MVQTQYPYIDEHGVSHNSLIKHWTDDEAKILLQVETGLLYLEAIDVYPCRFTYSEVDKPVEEEEEVEEENSEEEEEENN